MDQPSAHKVLLQSCCGHYLGCIDMTNIILPSSVRTRYGTLAGYSFLLGVSTYVSTEICRALRDQIHRSLPIPSPWIGGRNGRLAACLGPYISS